METIIQHIHAERNTLSDCGRNVFKGTETIEELAALFRTPQGVEFCEVHNFPSIETWRELDKAYGLARFGIYVDAGTVSLKNEAHVALIGSTIGELEYDELQRHAVMLMHGAAAKINASGHALVFVTNAGGMVDSDTRDFARIL